MMVAPRDLAGDEPFQTLPNTGHIVSEGVFRQSAMRFPHVYATLSAEQHDGRLPDKQGCPRTG